MVLKGFHILAARLSYYGLWRRLRTRGRSGFGANEGPPSLLPSVALGTQKREREGDRERRGGLYQTKIKTTESEWAYDEFQV